MIKSIPLPVDGRGILANQDLLQQMLEAVPESSRLAFLREAILSLSDEKRRELLNGLDLRPESPSAPAENNWLASTLSSDTLDTPELARPSPIKPKPMTEDQKQALMQAELAKLGMKSNPHVGKRRMQRQMAGCIMIGLLVAVLVVGLGIGGRKAFDWVRGRIDPAPISAPVAGDENN
ncbi:MAG: hypothetical protein QNK37_17700 [Acidobacteriota bacterium]|nr:hypothetical protein [Acidobacteriota bacterium]